MAEIGINFEYPIADLIETAVERKLVTAVEIIPDLFAYHQIQELRNVLNRYGLPAAFHFIDNSLGSADFASNNDLKAFTEVIREFDPIHVSDHLTFCRSGGIDLRQNLDVPHDQATLDAFVENIRYFRKRIGPKRKFLLENVSRLVRFKSDHIERDRFYREIVERSGSYFLLDIHNLYADEINWGLDAIEFIRSLPPELIREVHIAGGSWTEGKRVYIDSHLSKVPKRVFELLDFVLQFAEPELVVFERITAEGSPRKLSNEILGDLEQINEINRRWKRKPVKRSSRVRRAG